MALGLISLGAPLMIGWTVSVLHDVATELAEKFYGAMTTGQADRSPLAVRERCDQRDDPCWSLPVLYAGSRQARVFDPALGRYVFLTEGLHHPMPIVPQIPSIIRVDLRKVKWNVGLPLVFAGNIVVATFTWYIVSLFMR